MSHRPVNPLLNCPVCEENREVITKLISDVVRERKSSLGVKATGNAAALAKLVCNACGSNQKDFRIDLYYLHDNLTDIIYSVKSDKKGDYIILADQNHDDYLELFDTLAIMNEVKKSIDDLQSKKDFDGSDGQYSPNNCNCTIVCQCGEEDFTWKD